MKTLTEPCRINFRERGSKFIGVAFPCSSEIKFSDFQNELKAEYSDASHHCYAYRYDPHSIVEFSSDDGEPSGTAGLPILNQLKSLEIINVGVIVIRYFGGTKLGKAGLIEAYGRAAQLCLEEAELYTIKPVQLFEITYNYSQENTVNKLMTDFNLSEHGAEYLTKVKKTYACPLDESDRLELQLENYAHLEITFNKGKKSYLSFK